MNRVFLITRSNYPFGDANGYRFHTFAQLCEYAGFQPHVLCMGKNKSAVQNDPYNAITFCDTSSGQLSKMREYFSFISRCISELEKYNDVNAVICSTLMFTGDFRRLQKYCYKRGIVLIYSAVEWYSKEQYTNKFCWEYIKCNLYHERIIPDGYTRVIAISKYLQNYYLEHATRCVYIPAIIDVASNGGRKSLDIENVKIIYAGSPGKKDFIGAVVEAAASLTRDEINKMVLTIIGITEEQLISECDVSPSSIDKLGEHLIAHGRIPREQVIECYESSDFSILIRPENLRYAKAGFPTKFAESLLTGTPVICNLTSDLGDYCNDGMNSIIVRGESKEEIVIALRKAIHTSYAKRIEMCINARKTAEKYFDYRVFINELKNIVARE